ncbi:NitT/TauT family transport system permease protein [Amorphus suaedae]
MRTNAGQPRRGLVIVEQVVVVVLVLVAWQYASGRLVPEFYISNPVDITSAIMKWIANGSLWVHVGSTVMTLFVGYLLGAVIGIGAGLALGLAPRTERVVAPFLAALYGLPKVALLPLFVIFFGIGFVSKIALVASVVMFLLFYATLAGVRDIDRDVIEAMKLMGATSDEVTWKIRMPAILPWIYTGLRTSIGYALTTTVVSEALSSNRGLGFLIEYSASQFNSAGVFAAVVVLLVLSSVIMVPLGILERSAKPTRLIR